MERCTFPCTHCGRPQVFVRNTHQIHRGWVEVELVVLVITSISICVWGILVIPIFLVMGYMLFRSGTYPWWVCTGCGNCSKNRISLHADNEAKGLHPQGG